MGSSPTWGVQGRVRDDPQPLWLSGRASVLYPQVRPESLQHNIVVGDVACQPHRNGNRRSWVRFPGEAFSLRGSALVAQLVERGAYILAICLSHRNAKVVGSIPT